MVSSRAGREVSTRVPGKRANAAFGRNDIPLTKTWEEKNNLASSSGRTKRPGGRVYPGRLTKTREEAGCMMVRVGPGEEI